MLEVIALNLKDETQPVHFDTDCVEIMDGALVVLRKDRSTFLAGFAPGRWLTFQMVEG
ncbi:hypothetical protein CAURIC_08050 [Corynebacterium auriscanis]|nr:hypothetical protein [Corynebacterium auriscanis]WJY73223.1 hypothetical protein CAURIC_08050 [Corynebacterium auriscanis]